MLDVDVCRNVLEIICIVVMGDGVVEAIIEGQCQRIQDQTLEIYSRTKR